MRERKCPICRKPVTQGGEGFPFCSVRCKKIDLGQWIEGTYRVPDESDSPDESDMDAHLPEEWDG